MQRTQNRSSPGMDILKARTRSAHQRLERAPRLARLVEPGLTRQEYGDVLKRMLGYHEPAERAVEPYADFLPLDFDARRRAHLIAYDLDQLGYSRQTINEVPRCPYVADVNDLDSALGVLYVLEGSTLGGRIIRRRLERSIAVAADSGAAFYEGYGKNTGPMWKALGRAIDDRVAATGSIGTMEASARSTFTALYRWMTT